MVKDELTGGDNGIKPPPPHTHSVPALRQILIVNISINDARMLEGAAGGWEVVVWGRFSHTCIVPLSGYVMLTGWLGGARVKNSRRP